MTEPAIEFLELKGGLILPVVVIQLTCDLDRRGFTLVEYQGNLRVIPPRDTNGTTRDTLTENDRLAITKWKRHLLAAVAYVPPPIS